MEISAKELGIEIKWEGKGVDEKGYDSNSGKRIVFIDPRYFRPTEVDTLFGDSSKAREKLGWKPRISFEDMIIEMRVIVDSCV